MEDGRAETMTDEAAGVARCPDCRSSFPSVRGPDPMPEEGDQACDHPWHDKRKIPVAFTQGRENGLSIDEIKRMGSETDNVVDLADAAYALGQRRRAERDAEIVGAVRLTDWIETPEAALRESIDRILRDAGIEPKEVSE
jgi:hypothetical protein